MFLVMVRLNRHRRHRQQEKLLLQKLNCYQVFQLNLLRYTRQVHHYHLLQQLQCNLCFQANSTQFLVFHRHLLQLLLNANHLHRHHHHKMNHHHHHLQLLNSQLQEVEVIPQNLERKIRY
jgi:hypothetical protein